jgi:hypothetical protein
MSELLALFAFPLGVAGLASCLTQPASRPASAVHSWRGRYPIMSGSDEFDVAVVGGGPAGYMMAALLAREQHSVALIDPKPDTPWPNNYGAWRQEWEVRRLPPAVQPCGMSHIWPAEPAATRLVQPCCYAAC